MQSIIEQSNSSRKNVSKGRDSVVNRSFVGNFSRSIVPIQTDSSLIEEETNVRASMLLRFNLEDNYI